MKPRLTIPQAKALHRLRAAAYIRVSSEEQKQNHSPQTQRDGIRRYCETRDDIGELDFYEDLGHSGRSVLRPDFQPLLDKCQARQYDLIVVWRVDRLTRGELQGLLIVEMLLGAGVKVASVCEQFDYSPNGQMMLRNYLSFAQIENEIKSQRTRAGMLKMYEQGLRPNPPPQEYERGQDGIDVPKPERARFVAKLFELVDGGLSEADARRFLVDKWGWRLQDGSPPSKQRVAKTLRNEFYCGQVVVNLREAPRERVERLQVKGQTGFFLHDRLRKPEVVEVLRVRGKHEAIVSQALFDRVQDRLNDKGRKGRRRHVEGNPEFPLANFVVCDRCGEGVAGYVRRKRGLEFFYYTCRKQGCRAFHVRRSDLEAGFVEFLSGFAFDAGQMADFKKEMLALWRQEQQQAQGARRRVEAALRAVEERKDRLVGLYVDGAIGKREYESKLSELDALIQAKEAELQRGVQGFDMEGSLELAELLILDPAETWLQADAGGKRSFQRLLFPEGVRFDGHSFRTSVTCILFNHLRQKTAEASLVG